LIGAVSGGSFFDRTAPLTASSQNLSELAAIAIIKKFRTHPAVCRSIGNPATISVKRKSSQPAPDQRVSKRGQVAQVVERSPEKAGVGGSTPSLATILSHWKSSDL
jgi:hypothetical protein